MKPTRGLNLARERVKRKDISCSEVLGQERYCQSTSLCFFRGKKGNAKVNGNTEAYNIAG